MAEVGPSDIGTHLSAVSIRARMRMTSRSVAGSWRATDTNFDLTGTLSTLPSQYVNEVNCG